MVYHVADFLPSRKLAVQECLQVPGQEVIRSQESELDTGPELVIWGTNVVVNKCKQKFKRFIEQFVDETPAEDEVTEEIDRTLPLYLQKLEEVSF